MKNRIIKTLTLFLLFCQSTEASAQENSPTAQVEKGSEDATALIDRPLMSLKTEAEAVFNTMVYQTGTGWDAISQIVKELANDSSWNVIEEKARERAIFGGLLGVIGARPHATTRSRRGASMTEVAPPLKCLRSQPNEQIAFYVRPCTRHKCV